MDGSIFNSCALFSREIVFPAAVVSWSITSSSIYVGEATDLTFSLDLPLPGGFGLTVTALVESTVDGGISFDVNPYRCVPTIVLLSWEILQRTVAVTFGSRYSEVLLYFHIHVLFCFAA